MNNTISVIVPAYNVESFLLRSISSIKEQTYGAIEIVVVDDGSNDGCGFMSDNLALSDSRFTVIHKPNGGLSESRNYGMELSNGHFIGFVDGDDCISPFMYEHLITILKDYNADASECQMVRFTESPIYTTNYQCSELTDDNIIEGILNEKCFACAVPRMLLKSYFAKRIPFEVGKYHEDILWPFRVLSNCQKVVSSSAELYGYYQRAESIMNSAYSIKRFDALDALQTRAEEVKKNFPRLYAIAERKYAGTCMYQYQYLARQNECDEYKKYMKILYHRFSESDRKAFLPTVGFKYRIWYTMMLIAPLLTCRIRNFLKIGL